MIANQPLLLLRAVVVTASLSACAGPAVKIPEKVFVEVPVPCVKERPVRPEFYGRAAILAMDSHARTIAAWSDLRAAERYMAELAAVVEGCAQITR